MKVMADGVKYTGDWLNGKANGNGVKQLSNGTQFDGHWIDGKFINGKGIYPNGRVYEGEW